MKIFIMFVAYMFLFIAMAEDGIKGVMDIGRYLKNTNIEQGADCTEALKSAFELARKEKQYSFFFPPGYYNISDTIDISSANKIYSDGAIIAMKNPDKDILYTGNKWRINISGISLRGGKDQIVIGNNNTDQSFFIISECDFRDCSGYAIRILENTNSAHLVVEKSTFVDCRSCLYNVCDKADFKNCWVSTNKQNTDTAAFMNKGGLKIESLLGVPRVAKRYDRQRWIDNYGSVSCVDCRFGGEGGGFSIVYNFAAARFEYPVTPNFVSLERCEVYCAQKAAIVFFELPNKISISNCRGFTDCWMFDFQTLGRSELDGYGKVEGYQPGRIDDYLSGKKVKDYQLAQGRLAYKLPLSISVDRYEGRGTFPVALMPYTPPPIIYSGTSELGGFNHPDEGRWLRGSIVYNPNLPIRRTADGKDYKSPSNDALKEPFAWLCTESGVPGNWTALDYPVVNIIKNKEK